MRKPIICAMLLGFFLCGFDSLAQGCLNDVGILPDGVWSYSGVSDGSREAGNQTVIVEVLTETSTQKRWIKFDSLGVQRFELTECQAATRSGGPSVFVAHSEVLDSQLDVFRKVDVHLEAMKGHPVVWGSTLFSQVMVDHYSQPRVSRTSYFNFKPGYRIGYPPKYDRSGRVKLNWEGAQPIAVYRRRGSLQFQESRAELAEGNRLLYASP